MFNSEVITMLLEGIRDTVYMTVASTFFGKIDKTSSMVFIVG